MIIIDIPAEIIGECFVHRFGNERFVNRNMMLEPVRAGASKEFLQVVDLDYTDSAKCIERVCGKFSFTDVRNDVPDKIIGRDTSE